jgi:hypothetical protein
MVPSVSITRSLLTRELRTLGVLILGFACSDKGIDSSHPTEPDEEPPVYDLGSAITCPNPVESFDRFTEEASDRGLDFVASGWDEVGPCGAPPGGLAATDLDADGDVDLLFTRIHDSPALYVNDGGQLSEQILGLGSPTHQPNYSISAVDIDGDDLPELFSTGLGYLAMAANLGDLTFGEWEFIHRSEDYPMDCYTTVAHGDVDGDHDLDIFLPALDEAADADSIMPEDFEDYSPTIDRFFLNDEGTFTEVLQLSPEEDELGLSLLAVFTDRDGDQDLDILQGSDRPWVGVLPPSAFWRNEGPDWDGMPRLANDADEIGADAYISAMGLASADLNGDGAMDYCMSDIADQLTCLMSSGGSYYDGAYASGLVIDHQDHPDTPGDWEEQKGSEGKEIWVGWGLALVDFDVDGYPDMVGAAGPTPDQGTVSLSTAHDFQPDWMWRGQSDGTFRSAIPTVAFGSADAHYAIATVDLDGDGHREIILSGGEGVPEIWENPCSSGSWIEVKLVGAMHNRAGFGSRVSVVAGSDRWIQELYPLVANGQSPASLHFGLGNHSSVDTLKIKWLDGEETLVENFEPNRVVTVYHPDAER